MTQTVKNLPANAGDVGSIPGLGRSLAEENGYPLQYSCLENALGREAWQPTVHGVAESDMTEQLYWLPNIFLDTLVSALLPSSWVTLYSLVPLNIHEPPRFLPQLLIPLNVFLALTSEELCYLPGIYLSKRLQIVTFHSPSCVLIYANIYKHFTRVRKNGNKIVLSGRRLVFLFSLMNEWMF